MLPSAPMKVSNLRFAALLCHYSDQGNWLLLCGQTFSMLEPTSSADSPKTNNWCCFCLQVSFIVIHYLPSSALLAPLVGHGACNCRSTANKIQNSGFLLPFLTRKSITFIIQFKGSIVSSKWNLMGQGKIVHAHKLGIKFNITLQSHLCTQNVICFLTCNFSIALKNWGGEKSKWTCWTNLLQKLSYLTAGKWVKTNSCSKEFKWCIHFMALNTRKNDRFL
jgi:hypothetical protein